MKNHLFQLIKEYEINTGENLTQKELARRVGVSESVIRRWIRNEVRQISSDVVEGFCRELDCDISDLLYLERVEQ